MFFDGLKVEMEHFVVKLSPEEESIRLAIEPLLDSEGFELVKIKLKKTQAKSLLALYIDTKETQNGIVMANLADLSRLLSDVLDASFAESSLLNGRYDLEVSSPGLDRPLSRVSHFNNALGERVKVRLKVPYADGTKNILGALLLVKDNSIEVDPEGREEKYIVDFDDIADAHIVFDFSKLDANKKVNKK